jgi:hypothetical protein
MRNDAEMRCRDNSSYTIESPIKTTVKQSYLSEKPHVIHRGLDICQKLLQKHGIHSNIAMETGGFRYTNNGDAARCDQCELEVSGWTADMEPFIIHLERSPNCTFVRSFVQSSIIHASSSLSQRTTSERITSEIDDQGIPSKRQKIEVTNEEKQVHTLVEVDTLRQVRYRTFSHWPHRTSPSRAQMIQAGFFNCNVGDRVICLYCNLICQQWTPNVDDPCEVHKILSPHCPFVRAMLVHREATSIMIVNENLVGNRSSVANTSDAFRSSEIVLTAACNPDYMEIPKRHASFAGWPTESLPSVDDLVRAGFFYTGTNTIVTCFYCNGSLQNWGASDNPTIEHAKWFQHCLYVKQLCGDDLYRKIQESKRAQQGSVTIFLV